MVYMVCYDITDDKRRREVSKVLEQYGIRVQYSFFQCEIDKELLKELKKQLLEVIDTKFDALFFYPICEKCSRKSLTDGSGELIKIEAFRIL